MPRDYLLIGPLPKSKAGGIALGFKSLVEACKESALSVKVVDLSMAGEPVSTGRFSLLRCLQVAIPIVYSWLNIPFCRGVYLTISCSKVGFLRDYLILSMAFLWRKKTILHLKSGGYYEFYDSLGPRFRRLVDRTLSRSTRIIALGESIRSQFDFVQGHDEKVVVIENGPPRDIDDSEVEEVEARCEPIRVLFLSNMIYEKGFLHVLEACRWLKSQSSKRFQFHFCGSFYDALGRSESGAPGSAEELHAFASSIGLDSQDYVYHGKVDGKEKDAQLRQAAALALPTKYAWEGQPICIIEAMAFGVPVVATRWKSTADQVVDGVTGRFVSYGDSAGIGNAILGLVEDEAAYAEMRRASRERYLSHFTRRRHVERMLELFHSLVR